MAPVAILTAFSVHLVLLLVLQVHPFLISSFPSQRLYIVCFPTLLICHRTAFNSTHTYFGLHATELPPDNWTNYQWRNLSLGGRFGPILHFETSMSYIKKFGSLCAALVSLNGNISASMRLDKVFITTKFSYTTTACGR